MPLDARFPSKPRCDDELRTQLLDLFGVVALPNVFLLGPFAKYVTIYAQQVRALNLVWALGRSGYLSPRSRLAVVGGGIGGLTVAAAAALSGIREVHLYEKEPSLLRLQRNCEKRYIHPHIYDWPAPNATDDDAGLPVMNWHADTAANVAKALLDAFDTIVQKTKAEGRVLALHFNADVHLLQHAAVGLEVAGHEERFDAVVLATGFGLDGSEHTLSYWTDDELGAVEHEKKRSTWLVSGTGDGALTDLMRLCIQDFRHKHVLVAFDQHARGAKIGEHLLAADLHDLSTARAKAFLAAAKEIDARLGEIAFRDIGPVQLIVRPKDGNPEHGALFEPNSSVLNRLITAWLLYRNRFELVLGESATEQKQENGEIRVTLTDGSVRDISHFVKRHGTQRPLENQGWLESVRLYTEEQGKLWRTARKVDDWTRDPLYAPNTWSPGAEFPAALRIDFGAEIGAVVLVGSKQLRDPALHESVDLALQRFAKRKGTARYAPDRTLAVKSQLIRVHDALASPVLLERAVRALCTAEIAFFDLTGQESGMLLLLGVRAAVRRGLTLVVSQDDKGDLPFNIATLNPLYVGPNAEAGSRVNHLVEAMERGFHALVSTPDRYLDLPVYDALRMVGDDETMLSPQEEILVLRWFDDDYGRFINNSLVERLVNKFESAKVFTMLDSRSPQLVEQRLYAAIRRTQLCIADFTAFRANVFFEIGVRLAVNEHDPLFVLCDAPPEAAKARWPAREDPCAAKLEALFGVTHFAPGDFDRLDARLEAYTSPVPTALLSPGRIHRVVLSALDVASEPGGQSVERLLIRQAEQIAGANASAGNVPLAFGARLKDQARRAAVERLLAAWYYWDGRHRVLERLRKDEDVDPQQLKMLQDIGTNLIGRLRNTAGEFGGFQREIMEAVRLILRKTKP